MLLLSLSCVSRNRYFLFEATLCTVHVKGREYVKHTLSEILVGLYDSATNKVSENLCYLSTQLVSDAVYNSETNIFSVRDAVHNA